MSKQVGVILLPKQFLKIGIISDSSVVFFFNFIIIFNLISVFSSGKT